MGLLYVEEHRNCSHYQKGECPLATILKYNKGNTLERTSPRLSKLCFVKYGKINISIGGNEKKEVNKEDIFLLPPNTDFYAEVVEDAYIITLQFHVQVNLCERYSMTQLFPYYKEQVGQDFYTLKFTPAISRYLDLLDLCLSDGIHCMNFYEIKKQELFMLFRAYYPKEELALFFHPILSKEDLFFRNFVLERSLLAKNVNELAKMANYSTSGFIKKFTRCFNEAPHRWLTQYKADKILYAIKNEDKSLKEISSEYNFSSMSHFVNFCKKQFGETPGKMRKEGKL